MTVFEHQITDELRRLVGPPPRLDAMSIVRSVTTQAPDPTFQTMFSATKFVVAGVIVALFGGYLLSGALLQQPDDERSSGAIASALASPGVDPTTVVTAAIETSVADDPLPGVALVTEEVEPGVLRVVSDGYRDLSRTVATVSEMDDGTIVAGLDESVWVFSRDGLFRIGAEGMYGWDGDASWLDVEVAPDGTLWRTAGTTLRSFDGEAWTVRRSIAEGMELIGLAALPDGTIWVAWRQDECRACPRTRVGRLDADGWTTRQDRQERHREPLRYGPRNPIGRYRGDAFTVTDDSTVWLGGRVGIRRRQAA